MAIHRIRFLVGAAGSGKTRRILDELIALEAAGRRAFYLVPEQSTYVADRQILEPPGPAAIRHVRVVSFRRLAWIVDDASGVSRCRAVLDASGRRILLRALFAGLEARLRAPFRAIIDRPGFVESLGSALHELRSEAGPGLDAWLEGIGRKEMPADLAAKMETIRALRAACDRALLDRGLRDPERLLEETPERILARSDLFRDTPVLVDGFLSFTSLESQILSSLARTGAEVSISLCCDPALLEVADGIRPDPPSLRLQDWPSGIHARIRRPVFLASLRSLCELRARFLISGIAVRYESLAPAPLPRFRRSKELARLESSLLSHREESDRTPTPPVDVSLVAARDPSHEVETWARKIDHWIRLDDEPARPGDIAVIVRDLDMYRPIIEETFTRYRIPVFVDRHWEIGSRPLVRTVLDALEALLSGWGREAVIAFLRSPLIGVRPGEIDILENYSIEAGLDYEKWTGAPWEPLRRPPRSRYSDARDSDRDRTTGGLDLDGPGGEEVEEREESPDDRIEQRRAAIANRIRATVLEPWKEFENRWTENEGGAIPGREAIAALRHWCASAGIFERALSEGSAQKNPDDAARELEAFDHVCDQVAEQAGDERITIEIFARLLAAGLGTLRLGRTPTGLDRVTIAEVQRSRVGEVRHAILGGLCSRDFPRSVTAGRFFNESERARLLPLGLGLGPPTAMRQEEEGYFLYVAVTRAREKLLLTRPTIDLEGKPLEASPFIREICDALPGLQEEIPPIEESPADLADAQTTEDLAARVGAYIASRLDRRRAGRPVEPDPARAASEDRMILTVYNRLILSGRPGRRFLEESSRLWGYDNRPALPESVIAAAFGEDRVIASSAGRLETFAKCPYQHFARHILRLRPRPRAEVTPLENGILAHRALEVLYRAGSLPVEREAIRERLEEVFLEIEADPRLRAYRIDPAGESRWRATRGQLRRFLEIETKRLARSSFRPFLFEEDFGTTETSPLRIDLPGGGGVLLRGRIDRIDVRQPSGEGRPEALVLDYKSRLGPRQGHPALVEEGLDLQLAVYLLVVDEILGLDPAGALYVPVLPRPKGRQSEDPENPLDIRFAGLLPESERNGVVGELEIIRGVRKKLRDRGDLAVLLRQARAMITAHASGILEGRIDVSPVRSGRLACDICEFGGLCRVDRAYNPPVASPSARG